VFDIHLYGRELLTKLEQKGAANSPVLFCRAVAGHPPYEICRYFLAGLQLVCSWSLPSVRVLCIMSESVIVV